MIFFKHRVRAWLQEPFALFLLLGVALFAADRLINGAPSPRDSEGMRIVITASQQAALRETFHAEHGREPLAAELQARLDHWIEDQVLYREALALNLDRKDLIVHRQLTQKMRFLLEDATSLPQPSESDLRAWLDQHAQRYGQPPTISFEQVFLSRGRHGEDSQAQAARIGAQLARTPDTFIGLGDPFPVGQVFTAADPVQIRREFGPDFATATQKLAKGKWSGPIASGLGLHFVRVTALGEFHPAKLADVRAKVQADYQSSQRELLSRQALDRLKKKYRVEIEEATR